MKGKLPGAVTSAVTGLAAGLLLFPVGKALGMPTWAVVFGLLPLTVALVWLTLGVLWRVGWLR